ncbi:M56 family metallopeptidase [Polaribacter septentrionalilitoris]|uniref:M56 family metallopeptidase n=1 Tax=Polaribacter septentrionalilitoris TaxID=2494657 RepID=UPI0013569525|nr:M56 family metallopeptidase [Polaribacter septentrionalilitoris]
MINYILQVILFQVLFLAIYDFFLSKETFFTKNRWYLLSTPILSFLIPLIKIPTFQKAVPQEFIIYLPEIILSPEKVIQETKFYQSINYIDVVFISGIIVFSGLFLYKLFQIFLLIRQCKIKKQSDYTLVLIPNRTKAFSFFYYIFIGESISETQKKKIIQHELVHTKQKHSLDLLFFELLKIVMWFNPMVFLYQKRITLVHEYISDEVASKSEPKENYINHLLSNFFQVENISFINQFYKQSLLKKRIIMMTKTQSKKLNQLKYLVLIPALIGMLFYTSCTETEVHDDFSKTEKLNLESIQIKELKRVNKKLSDSIEILDKQKKVRENRIKHLEKLGFSNGIKNIETEEVSFMTIDKAPTFPGCESGDKKCFSKMIQKHFAKNFNANMVKGLGLSSGRKRVFIGFKIDKEGNVIDIKARAPHKDIKEEVISVMSTLPKMIPGEQKGEKVGVKYAIPFTLVVE